MRNRFPVLVAALAFAYGALAVALAQQHGQPDRPDHLDHRFDDPEHYAKSFDDPARDEWQMPPRVIEALGLEPDDAVADIGAGTGYFAVRLAKAVPQGRVYAVDIEAAMLEHIRKRAAAAGIGNIATVQATGSSPQLPAPVDAVLIVNTYHHIPGRVSYFRELARSLAPAGRIAIVDFRKDAPSGPPPEHRFEAEQIVTEMQQAGYRLDARHDFLPRQHFLIFRAARSGADWPRFRGANGSGISAVRSVPTEFGPARNVVWRLALPPGHSSPVLHGDRIFLTGFRDGQLLTFAIDRHAGRVVWERAAPLVPTKVLDKRNNPASPSPAVEADGVYVFFPDYGLLGYDASGKERWKLPLGPFNNIYGMGASPILVGDLVVLACDQSLGSYVMAVHKRTGRIVWKTERPEAKSGHSTPVVWRGGDGKDQILLPGSFLLTSYDAATGRKLWWVRGLSFEMKSTPVMNGDTIFVNGYGAPVNDPGNKVMVPPAEEVWKAADANGDGVLSKEEFPKFTPAFWFQVADLDTSGSISREEWTYYQAALDSENGMLAIRLGGSGDMTDTAVRWKYRRSVPQLPSPILYGGILYMVNDNGIVTMLDPATGDVIKQGRLSGAPGAVFASPIAAADHIFFTTQDGAVAVVEPGRDLMVTAVNDLDEEAYATPAIAEGRLYVRTTSALYAFGAPAP